MMPLGNSTDEEATAYHEAGHAIMGAIRDWPPLSVTIVPHGAAAGKNEFPENCRPEFRSHLGDSPEKRFYIESCILIGLAATSAHDLRFPARVRDAGDEQDE